MKAGTMKQCGSSARGRRPVRRGFTLVELLVVVAVILILMSISVPAVNSAREAARRAQCASNMRQVAVAINAYEAVQRRYPPAYTQTPTRHNVIAYILPELGQQAIADAYTFDAHWSSTANRTAAQAELEILHCPATPRASLQASTSDYAPCVLINTSVHNRLRDAGLITPRSDLRSMLQTGEQTRAHVRDGVSYSFLFFEDAGRPKRFERGGRPVPGNVTGARWADVEAYFHVHSTCGSNLINCTNGNEIFSFHQGGSMFAYGDAAVQFEKESMDPEVFVSLFTRAAGDVVGEH
jgi:prepilin-type N-terminal cleavage/methylation domain-containing protein